MKIEPEILHELLSYNPHTGDLVWKPRALKWFVDERAWKIWNTKNAGKIAGNIMKSSGYRRVEIFNKGLYAHRVIWAMQTGVWPEQVDHTSHDRADNRWVNLREVTHQENKKNAPRQARNTSGVTGVSFDKLTGKWKAQIKSGDLHIHLGRFTSLEDAAAARKAAEIKYDFHPNHGS